MVDTLHIDMKFRSSRGCDQPILSASPHDSWETSYRLHQVSCILQSGNSFMTSHHSHFKHRPWHDLLLPSALRSVSVTVVWMMTHRQLSFSEWWGLMVYVSAVGSAVSAWAGRVSITFITCVGWEMLDWFWIGTHSYKLTSFIKPKPLGLLHCHWLPGSLTFIMPTPPPHIIFWCYMSREHDTACDNGHCLTPHW